MLLRILAIFGIVSSSLASDLPLREGDCWTYSTRPGEEESFLVIRKIEALQKLGEVVHISVFNLRIKNPTAPLGYTDQVGHLPISAVSLQSSIKEKIQKQIPDIDWNGGYQMWLEAKGGVFTKPLREVVQAMEAGINKT